MEKEKKPRIIKRYQNRKLYDTEHSCYVTLDDIEMMIRNSEDLRVIDNKTGEDLTTLTLTQVILEGEKEKRHFLPLSALRGIIQTGGEQLASFFHKSIQSVPVLSSMKDEAEKVFDKIKDEIEDSGQFVRDFLLKSNQGIDEFSKKIEETIRSIGRFKNLPAVRSEVRSLRKKIATLERKLGLFERQKLK